MSDDPTVLRGGSDAPDEGDFLDKLGEFVDALPGAGAASEWGKSVVGQITDWFTKRTIAQQVADEGQRVQDSWDQFRSLLGGMVERDPTFADTAIGVGTSTAQKFVEDHPYLGDEHKPGLARRLATETAQDLIGGAAMVWAQISPDQAHGFLDRHQDWLTPEQLSGFRAGVDLWAKAKDDDAQTQQMRDQVYARNFSTAKLLDYASSMLDQRGNPMPRPVSQDALADKYLSPEDRRVVNALSNRAVATGGIDDGKITAEGALNLVARLQAGAARPQDALLLATTPNEKSVGQPMSASMQDAILLAQLMRNPDDARAYAEVLNAAKLRVASGDFGPSAGSINKLDLLAHDLLVRYGQSGVQAFEGYPKLSRGGYTMGTESFAARAEREAKLEDIFQRAQSKSVGEAKAAAQRADFTREKFRIEMEYRKARAEEQRQEREQAREEAAQRRAEQRAERQAASEASHQARTADVALRVQERAQERLSKEREEAMKEPRGTRSRTRELTLLEQFRRGYNLARD